MKFVVDIDNTICKSNKNYKESQPIFTRINKINKLYDDGNTIVYFTARGMNSFNGHKIIVMIKYYLLTRKQLKKWGAKHHKLILGKPSADFYIDDKAIIDKDFFGEVND
jgi:capsule biosynthesis phosphatase